MASLYLPNSVDFDNNCVVVLDNYRARVYDSQPTADNLVVDYTDFALDNHYISFYGVESFTQDSIFPTCYPTEYLSHAIIDRTDISDIFIVVMCFLAIFGFIFFKLIRLLFKGWF